MQINQLPTIPQAPANADVLMIEVNGITYKVSKQALAAAIAANITPANIGASAAMEFNGDQWTLASMYPIMARVPVPGSAILWLSPTSSGLLSGNKVRAYCTVIASRTNQSNWRFMAYTGNTDDLYMWHIEGWSGASATPTVGDVYKPDCSVELVLNNQTVDANGNINTDIDAGINTVISARCSGRIATPWVSGSTATWWIHLTNYTGGALDSGTNVGTVRVFYYTN